MEKGSHICFVYDCEYPWDVRVEKITDSLIQAGMKVHLVCRNKNRKSTYEQRDSLHIYRLPRFRSRRLNSLWNSTLFFNPYWLQTIYRVAKANQCRMIIVRDLPLALAGIIVGKRLRVPVIVDMAEPYPLTLRQRLRFEPFHPSHIVTRNLVFAEIIELMVIRYSHHIFVVCEEAKERLLKKGGKRSKITIIRNTPRIRELSALNKRLTSLSFPNDKFIITYVGLLIGGRGLELTLRAIKRIGKAREDIRLIVVGSGKKEEKLRCMAYKMGIDDVVTFEGWVSHDKVWDFISSSNLGILPFRPTQHMCHTVANKLFDFWAMERPVLCSDLPPMRRHITESRAGYLFEAGNEESLAKAILYCKRDPQIDARGKKGRQIVTIKYNWSNEEKRLLTLVETVGAPGRGSHEVGPASES